MGPNDNTDLGFQQRGGNLLNCSSSGMYTTSESENVEGMPMGSMSISRSLNSVDSFFGAGWDPYASLAQSVEFKGSPAASHNQIATSQYGIGILENQGISSTSHLVQYPSNASLIGLAPKLTCFGSGSGSFSDMVTSYDLPECGQIADACCPPNFSNKERGTEKTSRNGTVHSAICQEDRQISDERTGAPSPNGRKRKMAPEIHSKFDPIHRAEGEQQKDISKENIEGSKEHDEKKQKTEQNTGTNLRAKLLSKQAKDHSQSGEAPKDDFIHVRARRGQATNSHSLAERVRREKISERMRFLQDLVPGCNKITGKAVMLDEIINYVQSLQRQVEFLSMKLSTVNPELNIDIERILSKDILHSQGGYSALLGFSQGMSALNPQSHTSQCGSLAAIQSTNHHLLPMSQAPSVWDNELQNVMHFISNPDFDCLEPTGGMKVEL